VGAVVVGGRVVVVVTVVVVVEVVVDDVVMIGRVVALVEPVAAKAANVRASSAEARRSTPPLHFVFLLRATTSPDLQRTYGSSQRATPLWLLQVFENSELSEKLPSLHSANMPDGTVVVEPTVIEVAPVSTLVSSLPPIALDALPSNARTAMGALILAHNGHPR
jgi:hypothetical protein